MNQELVRFNYIFDKWGKSYDDTVYTNHGEYHEVFRNYKEILLKTVQNVNQPEGSLVVDIGTGTGNLAAVAQEYGYRVIGIEPNQVMREQAINKYPKVTFVEGNFLEMQFEFGAVDSIICSWAFHHLTDEEKAQALQEYYDLLSENGTVVIADTMYESMRDKERLLQEAIQNGYQALAEDLRREYYTTHDYLRQIFGEAGFEVSFEKMNQFVWILTAQKIAK